MRSILFLCLSFLFFVSCEDSEQQDLAEAQDCVNTSTGPAALSCLSKINGQTQRANALRCAAYFRYQNFTTSELVNIIDFYSDDSSASTDDLASELVFAGSPGLETNTQSAKDLSDLTRSVCVSSASGSKSLDLVSGVANFATTTANILNNIDPDFSIIADGSTPVTAAQDQDLGNIVLSMEASACADSSEGFCNDIDAILADSASSNPEDVGAALRRYLDP